MAERMKQALVFGLLFAAVVLTGCASFFVYPGSTGTGTGTGSTSGDYVYVANATTDTLSGFAVGTGTLTAVANSPYTLAYSPIAVVVNPANSLLYVAGGSLIYAYAINTNGSLTALNNGSAVAIADAISMDISPNGEWLFALDGNGVSIDEYQINTSTGALSQATGGSYLITNAAVVPRSLKVAPNGAFVFAALGTAGDVVFTYNETSGLMGTNPQHLAVGSTTTSDNAVAVSPLSDYLYIARSGTAGGLAVYSVAANTGALSAVSGSPFAAGTQPYAVALDSAGGNVYVANRGDSTISGYSVASGGVLTALSGSPYTAGTAVAGLVADQSKSYLLAIANGGSADLTMYTFDTTTAGKLDLTATTATGTDPTGPVAIAATH